MTSVHHYIAPRMDLSITPSNSLSSSCIPEGSTYCSQIVCRTEMAERGVVSVAEVMAN